MGKSICNINTSDFEIRLSGSGGQGLISAGVILAEAIGIGDNRNVVQTQSYGPEARGGATKCDVIISDTEIYFPECSKYDILLCLTQKAYEKYNRNLKLDGTIFIDEEAVEAFGDSVKVVEVPFIGTARDVIGSEIVANIVSLGFICEYTGVVTKKSLKWAVEKRFEGTRYLEMNIKAIEAGFKLAKEQIKNEKKEKNT